MRVASSAIFSLRRRPRALQLRECAFREQVTSASAAKLIVIREPQSKNIAVVFTNLHQERHPAPIQPAFLPQPKPGSHGLVPYLVRGVPKTSHDVVS